MVALSLLGPRLAGRCAINQGFFNIFIVILRDFVLSKEKSNLRWTRALGINLDPAPEGQKQLKGGMGVGVPILLKFQQNVNG